MWKCVFVMIPFSWFWSGIEMFNIEMKVLQHVTTLCLGAPFSVKESSLLDPWCWTKISSKTLLTPNNLSCPPPEKKKTCFNLILTPLPSQAFQRQKKLKHHFWPWRQSARYQEWHRSDWKESLHKPGPGGRFLRSVEVRGRILLATGRQHVGFANGKIHVWWQKWLKKLG